jgi:hypothetical protein
MLSLQRQRVISGSLIGLPVFEEEKMLMADIAGCDVIRAQC